VAPVPRGEISPNGSGTTTQNVRTAKSVEASNRKLLAHHGISAGYADVIFGLWVLARNWKGSLKVSATEELVGWRLALFGGFAVERNSLFGELAGRI